MKREVGGGGGEEGGEGRREQEGGEKYTSMQTEQEPTFALSRPNLMGKGGWTEVGEREGADEEVRRRRKGGGGVKLESRGGGAG